MAAHHIGSLFSQRPWLISILLFIGFSFWLGLGALKEEEQPRLGTKQEEQNIPLAKVKYQTFESILIAKKIDLYGRTAPDRQAKLGAEISGRVIALLVRKGDQVKKDQPLVQIDKADLEIQLERTQANLMVKEKEFKASQSLKNRGLQGEVAYSTALAALVEAKSLVKNAQLNLQNTQIKAPFDGIVDDLFIELGDFVGVGDPVARMIDLNVLVIEADVSERHVLHLNVNQKANIKLVGGEETEGSLRYISRVSSTSTNTFPIEIEIPNLEQAIPAGISAEVELEIDMQEAIKISSAMLALDESGNLGVKTIKDKKVHFVPIQMVKAEQDGVWLAGLGTSVDIITVGQGFVRDGDSVIAVKHQADNQ